MYGHLYRVCAQPGFYLVLHAATAAIDPVYRGNGPRRLYPARYALYLNKLQTIADGVFVWLVAVVTCGQPREPSLAIDFVG